MTTKHRCIGLGIVGVLFLAGCGAEGIPLLGDTAVSDELLEACEGVMDEAQIATALVTARIDRFNGYTKEEELAVARQNCLLESLWSDWSAEDCSACKSAILDEVYGP